MTDRRTFLILTGASGLLAACGGPAGPGSLTVNATGTAGMNPGPDGSDRPVTVQILQLRSTAAFNAADAFALQDPATALGADLVSATQIALAPGGSASQTIALDPATTAIGVVAGFRNPTGKQTRAVTGIDATANANATITVGPSGLVFTLG